MKFLMMNDLVLLAASCHLLNQDVARASASAGEMKASVSTMNVGVSAGEVMTTVQVAMTAGLPYTALGDAILTHSTLVEGLIPLFSSRPSIHESGTVPAQPLDAVA